MTDWDKAGREVTAAMVGLTCVTLGIALLLQIGLWLYQLWSML